MGFDLSGLNPKNETGEYFRNNVWWWRPLAQYVLDETKVIPEDWLVCSKKVEVPELINFKGIKHYV